MGSYASHSDTIHPTRASDLAEYCTACFNTGWVEYPKTLFETELDSCPHGCMDSVDLLDLAPEDVPTEHLAQYRALLPEDHPALPQDLEHAYSLISQEYRVEEKDPFLTLSQQFRLRGLKRFLSVTPSHRGLVSSDDYLQGFMRAGREVHHISIPPYLVGQVLDWDADYAHIQYDYLGSKLEVFVSHQTLMSEMRFAHSWDRGYSTAELIG